MRKTTAFLLVALLAVLPLSACGIWRQSCYDEFAFFTGEVVAIQDASTVLMKVTEQTHADVAVGEIAAFRYDEAYIRNVDENTYYGGDITGGTYTPKIGDILHADALIGTTPVENGVPTVTVLGIYTTVEIAPVTVNGTITHVSQTQFTFRPDTDIGIHSAGDTIRCDTYNIDYQDEASSALITVGKHVTVRFYDYASVNPAWMNSACSLTEA
ncbi:MAG: hypothetical protein QM689_10740 [Oscillospiraceae bacterium]